MSDEDEKEVSLRISRDSSGEVEPIEGVSPNLNIQVKVLPITVAQSYELESWGMPSLRWTAEDKARILRENVIEPSDFGDDLTAEELKNEFEAFAVDDIVQAVAIYSGYKRFFEEPDVEEGKGQELENISEIQIQKKI